MQIKEIEELIERLSNPHHAYDEAHLYEWCQEAASALTFLLEQTQWREIESAPKDGKPILGWADGEFTTVRWFGLQASGYWSLEVCGRHADDGEWWPTHWLPLPLPPLPEEDNG